MIHIYRVSNVVCTTLKYKRTKDAHIEGINIIKLVTSVHVHTRLYDYKVCVVK